MYKNTEEVLLDAMKAEFIFSPNLIINMIKMKHKYDCFPQLILYLCIPQNFSLTKLNIFPLPYSTALHYLTLLELTSCQITSPLWCHVQLFAVVEGLVMTKTAEVGILGIWGRHYETRTVFSPNNLRLDLPRFFVLSLIISWPGACNIDQF